MSLLKKMYPESGVVVERGPRRCRGKVGYDQYALKEHT